MDNNETIKTDAQSRGHSGGYTMFVRSFNVIRDACTGIGQMIGDHSRVETDRAYKHCIGRGRDNWLDASKGEGSTTLTLTNDGLFPLKMMD